MSEFWPRERASCCQFELYLHQPHGREGQHAAGFSTVPGRVGMVGAGAELDRKTLARVEMPKADGVVSDPRPNVE